MGIRVLGICFSCGFVKSNEKFIENETINYIKNEEKELLTNHKMKIVISFINYQLSIINYLFRVYKQIFLKYFELENIS